MKKPIKILWICHFSNEEINKHFKTNVNYFAPWIDQLIKLFEGSEEVQVTILAPNVFTYKNDKLTIRGIDYYFYKYSPDWIKPNLYEKLRLGYISKYPTVIKNTKNIIDEINPDVIHFHGAENLYYSVLFNEVKNRYKCFLTIQGFAFLSETKSFIYNYFHKIRTAVEKNTIRKVSRIGVRTEEMANIVKELNPECKLFWHNYPINIPTIKSDPQKKYDIAFFARVTKNKGIEDLIEATRILKERNIDLSVIVIGDGSKSYLEFLKNKIAKYKLESNYDFQGFKKQEEAYELLGKSHLYVIPTYHDIIPGTLIENMFLKIPSIAYNVGGIPSLNDNMESVILVEKGDIDSLASSIYKLHNDEKLRNQLSENAYNVACSMFDNNKVKADLEKIYSIIDNEK